MYFPELPASSSTSSSSSPGLPATANGTSTSSNDPGLPGTGSSSSNQRLPGNGLRWALRQHGTPHGEPVPTSGTGVIDLRSEAHPDSRSADRGPHDSYSTADTQTASGPRRSPGRPCRAKRQMYKSMELDSMRMIEMDPDSPWFENFEKLDAQQSIEPMFKAKIFAKLQEHASKARLQRLGTFNSLPQQDLLPQMAVARLSRHGHHEHSTMPQQDLLPQMAAARLSGYLGIQPPRQYGPNQY
jgi:hypothetical protein